jgi:CheY-like chemotaxis protein
MKNGKKILLIEDDRVIAKAYGEQLVRTGYSVAYAYDGLTGVQKSKKSKPDLILLDLILPRLDGISVMKKIMSDPETAHIPIIVLSNLSTSDKISQVLEAGSTTFLVKSNHSLEDVVRKVKETLEQSHD